MYRIGFIVAGLTSLFVGCSGPGQDSASEEIGSLENLILEHVERARANPNFASDSEELVYPNSEYELLGLLDKEYVVLKLGTDDCPPCRNQAARFEELADLYQIDGRIGFFEADLGKLRDPTSWERKRELIDRNGLPDYGIWHNPGNGFEFVGGSLMRGVDELIGGVESFIPDAPVVELHQKFYLDLNVGKMVDWFVLDRIDPRSGENRTADAMEILRSIESNPEKTRLWFDSFGKEWGVVREYDLADSKERFDAVNGLSGLGRGNYDSEGRIGLSKLERAYMENIGRAFDSEGIVIDIDEYGLREMIEFFRDPEVAPVVQDYLDNSRWGESFDIDWILMEGRLLDGGGRDENGVERSDIATARTIIGDVLSPVDKRVRDFRQRFSVAYAKTFFPFIPNEVVGLVEAYRDSIVKPELVRLRSNDLEAFIERNVPVEKDGRFKGFVGELRDYHARVSDIVGRMDDNLIFYGTGGFIDSGGDDGVRIFVGVPVNDFEALDRVVGFYERVRERYGKGLVLRVLPLSFRYLRTPSMGDLEEKGLSGFVGANGYVGSVGIFNGSGLVYSDRLPSTRAENEIFKYLDGVVREDDK
jgi:thiol-disulfide isomerase/thioredoxin